MKPNNCNEDMLPLDAGGYDGATWSIASTTVHHFTRDDRQIARMAVRVCSVTSRTVAQHIKYVMHHSVSARTIRRRLHRSGLSAIRPLLGLPWKNQRCDERRMWTQNRMKLYLLTSHASVCNTTMVGFKSGDTVEKGC
ncbi:HTH_38 domain-containing protein [Trichonephila clavipes]|uniref:HTH_38 domain-containing protein n=1 Tax=Trichonephila clavipes TaxID=2585209 RepID=A0A8X7BEG0_TRICX|nr:HTH_38 domain-containing protein [Trichonephila clavipes]